ncbi:MAG TPA: hypothetical protein VNM22_10890 [Candidatus Limnocylindrales bacterium]|nr:hypothetical protein [Candidatus Limnocylindrales bacterium]
MGAEDIEQMEEDRNIPIFQTLVGKEESFPKEAVKDKEDKNTYSNTHVP